MQAQRKQYSAEFKARTALEARKGLKPTYGVAPVPASLSFVSIPAGIPLPSRLPCRSRAARLVKR
jgi:hypothetical protein